MSSRAVLPKINDTTRVKSCVFDDMCGVQRNSDFFLNIRGSLSRDGLLFIEFYLTLVYDNRSGY